MDALALLCNLYGDGPATLERLREADCSTFERLQRMPVDVLAGVLRTTPAGARRFLREARMLAERIQVSEPEESAPPTFAGVASSRAPAPVAFGNPPQARGAVEEAPRSRVASGTTPAEGRSAPADSPTPAASPSNERAHESPASNERVHESPASNERVPESPASALARVLQTWRERDAAELQRASGTEPEPDSAPELAEDAEDTEDTEDTEDAIDGTPLEPGLFEGLDGSVARALADAGVDTVEDLLAGEAGELGRVLGLGPTRVLRLQFLGRRWYEENAEEPEVTVIPVQREVEPARTAPHEAPIRRAPAHELAARSTPAYEVVGALPSGGEPDVPSPALPAPPKFSLSERPFPARAALEDELEEPRGPLPGREPPEREEPEAERTTEGAGEDPNVAGSGGPFA